MPGHNGQMRFAHLRPDLRLFLAQIASLKGVFETFEPGWVRSLLRSEQTLDVAGVALTYRLWFSVPSARLLIKHDHA